MLADYFRVFYFSLLPPLFQLHTVLWLIITPQMAPMDSEVSMLA
jgi:hypothetical protein